jgi:hypothetical protein
MEPSAIEYEGCFPMAHVVYKHLTGIQLTLDALGSFDVAEASDQYQHSALPLALFILQVENMQVDQLPVTLVFSWQHLNGVGGYAGTPINEPDLTAPVFRPALAQGCGLVMPRCRIPIHASWVTIASAPGQMIQRQNIPILLGGSPGTTGRISGRC